MRLSEIVREFLDTDPSELEIEEFYINRILSTDKRSLNEIIEGEEYNDWIDYRAGDIGDLSKMQSRLGFIPYNRLESYKYFEMWRRIKWTFLNYI